MRRWRFRTVLCLLVVVSVLAIVTTSPAHAADGLPPSGSRRTSTCGYIISFDENSSSLSPSARAVVMEALNQERQTRSGRIAVSGYWSRQENSDIVGARVNTVIAELANLGTAAHEVVSLDRSADSTPSNAMAYISTCAPPNSVGSTPTIIPPDPDRVVRFAVGTTRFAIPLRYLDPIYWDDTPFELVERRSVGVEVEWPSLADRLWLMQHDCGLPLPQSCEDHIARITFSLRRPTRASSPDAVPDIALGYIPVAGEAFSTRFAIEPRGRTYAAFVATRSNGEDFVGNCRFESALPGGDSPKIEDVTSRLDTRSYCSVKGIAFGANLHAIIGFSGSNFSNWDPLVTSMVKLAHSFLKFAQ